MTKVQERLIQLNKPPLEDPELRDAVAFRDLIDDGRTLPMLDRFETRLSRQFDRCLRRLVCTNPCRMGSMALTLLRGSCLH